MRETVSTVMVWLLHFWESMRLQTYVARITSRWRSKPVVEEPKPTVNRSVCQTILVVGAPELRPPLEDVVALAPTGDVRRSDEGAIRGSRRRCRIA